MRIDAGRLEADDPVRHFVLRNVMLALKENYPAPFIHLYGFYPNGGLTDLWLVSFVVYHRGEQITVPDYPIVEKGKQPFSRDTTLRVLIDVRPDGNGLQPPLDVSLNGLPYA